MVNPFESRIWSAIIKKDNGERILILFIEKKQAL